MHSCLNCGQSVDNAEWYNLKHPVAPVTGAPNVTANVQDGLDELFRNQITASNSDGVCERCFHLLSVAISMRRTSSDALEQFITLSSNVHIKNVDTPLLYNHLNTEINTKLILQEGVDWYSVIADTPKNNVICYGSSLAVEYINSIQGQINEFFTFCSEKTAENTKDVKNPPKNSTKACLETGLKSYNKAAEKQISKGNVGQSMKEQSTSETQSDKIVQSKILKENTKISSEPSTSDVLKTDLTGIKSSNMGTEKQLGERDVGQTLKEQLTSEKQLDDVPPNQSLKENKISSSEQSSSSVLKMENENSTERNGLDVESKCCVSSDEMMENNNIKLNEDIQDDESDSQKQFIAEPLPDVESQLHKKLDQQHKSSYTKGDNSDISTSEDMLEDLNTEKLITSELAEEKREIVYDTNQSEYVVDFSENMDLFSNEIDESLPAGIYDLELEDINSPDSFNNDSKYSELESSAQEDDTVIYNGGDDNTTDCSTPITQEEEKESKQQSNQSSDFSDEIISLSCTGEISENNEILNCSFEKSELDNRSKLVEDNEKIVLDNEEKSELDNGSELVEDSEKIVMNNEEKLNKIDDKSEDEVLSKDMSADCSMFNAVENDKILDDTDMISDIPQKDVDLNHSKSEYDHVDLNNSKNENDKKEEIVQEIQVNSQGDVHLSCSLSEMKESENNSSPLNEDVCHENNLEKENFSEDLQIENSVSQENFSLLNKNEIESNISESSKNVTNTDEEDKPFSLEKQVEQPYKYKSAVDRIVEAVKLRQRKISENDLSPEKHFETMEKSKSAVESYKKIITESKSKKTGHSDLNLENPSNDVGNKNDDAQKTDILNVFESPVLDKYIAENTLQLANALSNTNTPRVGKTKLRNNEEKLARIGRIMENVRARNSGKSVSNKIHKQKYEDALEPTINRSSKDNWKNNNDVEKTPEKGSDSNKLVSEKISNEKLNTTSKTIDGRASNRSNDSTLETSLELHKDASTSYLELHKDVSISYLRKSGEKHKKISNSVVGETYDTKGCKMSEKTPNNKSPSGKKDHSSSKSRKSIQFHEEKNQRNSGKSSQRKQDKTDVLPTSTNKEKIFRQNSETQEKTKKKSEHQKKASQETEKSTKSADASNSRSEKINDSGSRNEKFSKKKGQTNSANSKSETKKSPWSLKVSIKNQSKQLTAQNRLGNLTKSQSTDDVENDENNEEKHDISPETCFENMQSSFHSRNHNHKQKEADSKSAEIDRPKAENLSILTREILINLQPVIHLVRLSDEEIEQFASKPLSDSSNKANSRTFNKNSDVLLTNNNAHCMMAAKKAPDSVDTNIIGKELDREVLKTKQSVEDSKMSKCSGTKIKISKTNESEICEKRNIRKLKDINTNTTETDEKDSKKETGVNNATKINKSNNTNQNSPSKFSDVDIFADDDEETVISFPEDDACTDISFTEEGVDLDNTLQENLNDGEDTDLLVTRAETANENSTLVFTLSVEDKKTKMPQESILEKQSSVNSINSLKTKDNGNIVNQMNLNTDGNKNTEENSNAVKMSEQNSFKNKAENKSTENLEECDENCPRDKTVQNRENSFGKDNAETEGDLLVLDKQDENQSAIIETIEMSQVDVSKLDKIVAISNLKEDEHCNGEKDKDVGNISFLENEELSVENAATEKEMTYDPDRMFLSDKEKNSFENEIKKDTNYDSRAFSHEKKKNRELDTEIDSRTKKSKKQDFTEKEKSGKASGLPKKKSKEIGTRTPKKKDILAEKENRKVENVENQTIITDSLTEKSVNEKDHTTSNRNGKTVTCDETPKDKVTTGKEMDVRKFVTEKDTKLDGAGTGQEVDLQKITSGKEGTADGIDSSEDNELVKTAMEKTTGKLISNPKTNEVEKFTSVETNNKNRKGLKVLNSENVIEKENVNLKKAVLDKETNQQKSDKGESMRSFEETINESVTENELYECLTCKKKFIDESAYQYHRFNKHRQDNKVDICTEESSLSSDERQMIQGKELRQRRKHITKTLDFDDQPKASEMKDKGKNIIEEKERLKEKNKIKELEMKTTRGILMENETDTLRKPKPQKETEIVKKKKKSKKVLEIETKKVETMTEQMDDLETNENSKNFGILKSSKWIEQHMNKGSPQLGDDTLSFTEDNVKEITLGENRNNKKVTDSRQPSPITKEAKHVSRKEWHSKIKDVDDVFTNETSQHGIRQKTKEKQTQHNLKGGNKFERRIEVEKSISTNIRLGYLSAKRRRKENCYGYGEFCKIPQYCQSSDTDEESKTKDEKINRQFNIKSQKVKELEENDLDDISPRKRKLGKRSTKDDENMTVYTVGLESEKEIEEKGIRLKIHRKKSKKSERKHSKNLDSEGNQNEKQIDRSGSKERDNIVDRNKEKVTNHDHAENVLKESDDRNKSRRKSRNSLNSFDKGSSDKYHGSSKTNANQLSKEKEVEISKEKEIDKSNKVDKDENLKMKTEKQQKETLSPKKEFRNLFDNIVFDSGSDNVNMSNDRFDSVENSKGLDKARTENNQSSSISISQRNSANKQMCEEASPGQDSTSMVKIKTQTPSAEDISGSSVPSVPLVNTFKKSPNFDTFNDGGNTTSVSNEADISNEVVQKFEYINMPSLSQIDSGPPANILSDKDADEKTVDSRFPETLATKFLPNTNPRNENVTKCTSGQADRFENVAVSLGHKNSTETNDETMLIDNKPESASLVENQNRNEVKPNIIGNEAIYTKTENNLEHFSTSDQREKTGKTVYIDIENKSLSHIGQIENSVMPKYSKIENVNGVLNSKVENIAVNQSASVTQAVTENRTTMQMSAPGSHGRNINNRNLVDNNTAKSFLLDNSFVNTEIKGTRDGNIYDNTVLAGLTTTELKNPTMVFSNGRQNVLPPNVKRGKGINDANDDFPFKRPAPVPEKRIKSLSPKHNNKDEGRHDLNKNGLSEGSTVRCPKGSIIQAVFGAATQPKRSNVTFLNMASKKARTLEKQRRESGNTTIIKKQNVPFLFPSLFKKKTKTIESNKTRDIVESNPLSGPSPAKALKLELKQDLSLKEIDNILPSIGNLNVEFENIRHHGDYSKQHTSGSSGSIAHKGKHVKTDIHHDPFDLTDIFSNDDIGNNYSMDSSTTASSDYSENRGVSKGKVMSYQMPETKLNDHNIIEINEFDIENSHADRILDQIEYHTSTTDETTNLQHNLNIGHSAHLPHGIVTSTFNDNHNFDNGTRNKSFDPFLGNTAHEIQSHDTCGGNQSLRSKSTREMDNLLLESNKKLVVSLEKLTDKDIQNQCHIASNEMSHNSMTALDENLPSLKPWHCILCQQCYRVRGELVQHIVSVHEITQFDDRLKHYIRYVADNGSPGNPNITSVTESGKYNVDQSTVFSDVKIPPQIDSHIFGSNTLNFGTSSTGFGKITANHENQNTAGCISNQNMLISGKLNPLQTVGHTLGNTFIPSASNHNNSSSTIITRDVGKATRTDEHFNDQDCFVVGISEKKETAINKKDDNSWKCLICGITFLLKIDVIQHVRMKHKKMSSDTVAYAQIPVQSSSSMPASLPSKEDYPSISVEIPAPQHMPSGGPANQDLPFLSVEMPMTQMPTTQTISAAIDNSSSDSASTSENGSINFHSKPTYHAPRRVIKQKKEEKKKTKVKETSEILIIYSKTDSIPDGLFQVPMDKPEPMRSILSVKWHCKLCPNWYRLRKCCLQHVQKEHNIRGNWARFYFHNSQQVTHHPTFEICTGPHVDMNAYEFCIVCGRSYPDANEMLRHIRRNHPYVPEVHRATCIQNKHQPYRIIIACDIFMDLHVYIVGKGSARLVEKEFFEELFDCCLDQKTGVEYKEWDIVIARQMKKILYECGIINFNPDVVEKLKDIEHNFDLYKISFQEDFQWERSKRPTSEDSEQVVMEICDKEEDGETSNDLVAADVQVVSLYKCHKCNITFPDRITLDQHNLTHKVTVKFTCRLCNKNFPKLFFLLQHLEIKHNQKHPSYFQFVLEHEHVIGEYEETEKDPTLTLDETDSEDEKSTSQESSETDTSTIDLKQSSNDDQELDEDDVETTESRNCYVCGKIFETRVAIFTHLKEKHKIHNRKCLTCNKCCTSKLELQKHFAAAHDTDFVFDFSEQLFRCYICDLVLENRKELMDHLPQHDGDTYSCNLCDMKYSSGSSLRFHKRTVHWNLEGTRSCKICDNKIFTNMKAYETHMLNHFYDYLGPMKCSECNITVKNKKLYKQHVASHGVSLVCEHCGKVCIDQNALRHHIVTHNLNETCQICDKKLNKYSIRNHMLKVHGEKPKVTCHLCGKLVNQSYMSSHIEEVHYKLKDIKRGKKDCDICGKTFKRPGLLKTHMVVHTGEKPYECQVCGRCFGHKTALNTHYTTHKGFKPYQCQFCTESFWLVSQCKTHMRRDHGYVDPECKNACEFCEKRFKRLSGLRLHLDEAHPEEVPGPKFYPCHICKRQFKYRKSLREHIAICSPGTELGNLYGSRHNETNTAIQNVLTADIDQEEIIEAFHDISQNNLHIEHDPHINNAIQAQIGTADHTQQQIIIEQAGDVTYQTIYIQSDDPTNQGPVFLQDVVDQDQIILQDGNEEGEIIVALPENCGEYNVDFLSSNNQLVHDEGISYAEVVVQDQ